MNRRRFLQATTAAAVASTTGLPLRSRAQDASPVPPLPALLRDVPICDGHIHLWDPAKLDYAWIKGTPIAGPHLPADLRRAAGSLDLQQAVFVQAECRHDQATEEVAWVETQADVPGGPKITGIVAFAPVEVGEKVESTLAALAAWPLVKGVRRLIQGEHEPEFALRPDFVEGVRRLGRYNLSFGVGARADQLPDVFRLAEECPEVVFVLDHLGQPHIRERSRDPWEQDLARLATLQNVWCKVSAATTLAGKNWQVADLRPYVRHAIDCFGWDRTFFGGDWPNCDLTGSYQRWVAALAEIVADDSDDERRRLFARTAQRCYRLPPTTSPEAA